MSMVRSMKRAMAKKQMRLAGYRGFCKVEPEMKRSQFSLRWRKALAGELDE